MSISNYPYFFGYQQAQKTISFGSSHPLSHTKEKYSSADLVSLAWLQKGDILKIAPLDTEEDRPQGNQLTEQDTPGNGPKQTFTICEPGSTFSNVITGQISAPHIVTSNMNSSYVNSTSVNVHRQHLSKPCYSYTHLIFLAIESTPSRCMTVNQIYSWCERNFSFYKNAGPGWKNSLRHNLSINKSFRRLPRDGRGPGRGAYWAVEPRERLNLLDAIKRNPWSLGLTRERPVVRSLPFNSTQSYATITNDAPRFNFRGIMQETTLRSSGKNNLILSSSHSGASSPFSLIETSELPLEQNAIPIQGNVLQMPRCNTAAHFIHSYLPFNISENENPCLQDTVHGFEPWPADEEEKYRDMVRLLIEGHEVENSCSGKAGQEDAAINAAVTDATVKPKTDTRGRRKSSLNPTTENMCNKCKENAVSVCRSCSLQQWSQPQHNSLTKMRQFSTLEGAGRASANFTKLGNYASESPMEQLLESLDEDQEIPSPNSRKRPPPISFDGEVFITPAPYHDHEYSHCQPQLRRPAETRLVELMNAKLRQERWHFIRGHTDSRVELNSNSKTYRLMASVKASVGENLEQPTASLSERNEEYEYEDTASYQSSTHEFSQKTKQHTRRTGACSRKRRKRSNVGGRQMSKTRRGTSHNIRAGSGSFEDFSEEIYDTLDYADDNAYAEINYFASPPYLDRYQRRSGFISTDTKRRQVVQADEEDQEHTKAYKPCRRRLSRNSRSFQPEPVTRGSDKSQLLSPNPISSLHKQRLVARRQPQRLKEVLEAVGLFSSVNDNQIRPKVKSPRSSDHSLEEVETKIEQSTTQAEHILADISQMKDFRLQSGYLSLDSTLSSEESVVPSPASS